MADALAFLRDAVGRGAAVTLDGDVLVVEGVRVPRRMPTAYRNRTEGGYYALDAVWFQWAKRDLPRAQYVSEAYAAGIAFVSQQDRADLLNYIAGEIASSHNVDPAAPVDPAWLALRGTAAL
jgi:hypothetical protein